MKTALHLFVFWIVVYTSAPCYRVRKSCRQWLLQSQWRRILVWTASLCSWNFFGKIHSEVMQGGTVRFHFIITNQADLDGGRDFSGSRWTNTCINIDSIQITIYSFSARSFWETGASGDSVLTPHSKNNNSSQTVLNQLIDQVSSIAKSIVCKLRPYKMLRVRKQSSSSCTFWLWLERDVEGIKDKPKWAMCRQTGLAQIQRKTDTTLG